MTYLTKAMWGGRPATSTTPFERKLGVTLHWEGPTMNITRHEQCINAVRNIQSLHMSGRNSDGRPWADIAYNAVVCEHGYVFEGRGLNARSAANGTNAGNATWAAVCYLGGIGDAIPNEGWDGLRDAVVHFRNNGGFGQAINGHRDHKPTQCPGNVIYGAIGSLMNNHDNPTTGPIILPSPPVPNDPYSVEAMVTALPIVRRGSTGQHALIAQGLLNANGRRIAIDGDFGPASEAALVDWQRASGKAPDGVIGPISWRGLLCI